MGEQIRQAHKLKQTTRCVMPEHLIFVDVETTQHQDTNNKIYHQLKLGVGIHYRNRRDGINNKKTLFRFTDEYDFWGWVESKAIKKSILYLISHNAVFDFIVLRHIKHLTQLGYKCLFIYEGGVRFIAKWRKKNHTIMILDNSNWFAGKLERWGKELDLPKLVMPKSVDSTEKWFIYCKRDAEILFELFIWYTSFLKSNDLGTWKYTIASQAFTSFRHRFMSHPIYIPADNQETKIARESYHGGRTECFQIGEYNNESFYKVDVNSMYPYVMHHYRYPTNFDGIYDSPNIHRVLKSLETKAIIGDVLLDTPIPLFVAKKDGRNVYPLGVFRTTLCSEELRIAIENGWIKKIYSCVVYRSRFIFIDYVDFFYRIKQDASMANKPLLRSFSKLYLNSLYGKFGQRGFSDSIIGEDTEDTIRVSYGYNMQSGERFILRQIGKQVLYSERKGEGYNSFCAIASHVTANARIYLYSIIIMAGRENCFYCDTDSVIVNKKGLERLSSLMDDTRLGFLKIEGQCNKIEIIAPKHYYFDKHWVVKGVRKTAVQVDPNTYKQEVWPGLNTILKTQEERYFNYFITKHLNPRIVSGIVGKKGNVKPFVMD